MIKKVNVYPVYPILTIRNPIYHTALNIELSIGDIERCIYSRAKVEEILSDGKIITLNLENYNKCNYMEEHINKSVASLPENKEDVDTNKLVNNEDSDSEEKEAAEQIVNDFEAISPVEEDIITDSEVEENLVVNHNKHNKKNKR